MNKKRSTRSSTFRASSSQKPETAGADLWAWLFVHAPELSEIPKDLPPGSYRAAVELANEATFTQGELEAYRKVMDEIQQAREYGEAQLQKGRAEGKASAILAVFAARGIELSAALRARIEACNDLSTLDRWIAQAVSADSAEELFRP